MGRIKDLINAFLKPSESAKTFDELAVEEGIKPEILKALKATQNGVVGWTWHSEEQEASTKRGRQSGLGKVTSEKNKQPKKSIQQTIDNDLER